MTNNNDRYDLSDRLVHFFRQVDLASADFPKSGRRIMRALVVSPLGRGGLPLSTANS
jgi:hypothetical protein